MKLILLGPPGAGKGTVAKKLAVDFNLEHISTGDIFRAEIKAGTDLGRLAASYMDNGRLVPDDVTVKMVKGYLREDFILDGVPRTGPQAEYLEREGLVVDSTIYLDVPDEHLVGRLSSRRVCGCGMTYGLASMPKKENLCDDCGDELVQRKDDQPETIEKRLQIYARQTAPLLQFYQDRELLEKIDGSQEPSLVYQAVKKLVESLQP